MVIRTENDCQAPQLHKGATLGSGYVRRPDGKIIMQVFSLGHFISLTVNDLTGNERKKAQQPLQNYGH